MLCLTYSLGCPLEYIQEIFTIGQVTRQTWLGSGSLYPLSALLHEEITRTNVKTHISVTYEYFSFQQDNQSKTL